MCFWPLFSGRRQSTLFQNLFFFFLILIFHPLRKLISVGTLLSPLNTLFALSLALFLHFLVLQTADFKTEGCGIRHVKSSLKPADVSLRPDNACHLSDLYPIRQDPAVATSGHRGIFLLPITRSSRCLSSETISSITDSLLRLCSAWGDLYRP